MLRPSVLWLALVAAPLALPALADSEPPSPTVLGAHAKRAASHHQSNGGEWYFCAAGSGSASRSKVGPFTWLEECTQARTDRKGADPNVGPCVHAEELDCAKP